MPPLLQHLLINHHHPFNALDIESSPLTKASTSGRDDHDPSSSESEGHLLFSRIDSGSDHHFVDPTLSPKIMDLINKVDYFHTPITIDGVGSHAVNGSVRRCSTSVIQSPMDEGRRTLFLTSSWLQMQASIFSHPREPHQDGVSISMWDEKVARHLYECEKLHTKFESTMEGFECTWMNVSSRKHSKKASTSATYDPKLISSTAERVFGNC